MGRPRLQYLKQVARNIGADSYTTMKRIARSNPDGKLPTNQKIEEEKELYHNARCKKHYYIPAWNMWVTLIFRIQKVVASNPNPGYVIP